MRGRVVLGLFAFSLLLAGAEGLAGALRPAEVRVGIVTFLSGPPGAAYGIPARNAAEVLLDELNAGRLPAPYSTRGFGGVPVRPVIVDEAGGAEKQVAEFRRLVLDERVDLVIGYLSSADCLAAAPVAEELRALLILFGCATHQIFEERTYRYVFRTTAHQVPDNVAAARYVLQLNPEAGTVAGINQDYALGHDAWNTFRDAVRKLKPEMRVLAEWFPRLFAGEYAAEISALLAAGPHVVHTTFWGGDLESFLLQALPRRLHERSTLVLVAGETALARLGQQVPPGVVVGGRAPLGARAAAAPLNRWFREVYTPRFGVRPVSGSYQMAQAVFGAKYAYEKALAANRGVWPTREQVAAALRAATFETPTGTVRMALGGGHQAVEGMTYGITSRYNSSLKEMELTRVVHFPAECVNPPEGMKSEEWVARGFPGARCP